MLTIIWHLLSDPQARYHDLGSGYYESTINKAAANVTSSANSNTAPARKSPSPPGPALPPPDPPRYRQDPVPLTLRRVPPRTHYSSIFESAADLVDRVPWSGRGGRLLRIWVFCAPARHAGLVR
jgi:hypothetical protein